jgi:hypothetical protein
VKYVCLDVKQRSKFDKKKKVLKTYTWVIEDDSATSSSDDDTKLKELANLCMMSNMGICHYRRDLLDGK